MEYVRLSNPNLVSLLAMLMVGQIAKSDQTLKMKLEKDLYGVNLYR